LILDIFKKTQKHKTQKTQKHKISKKGNEISFNGNFISFYRNFVFLCFFVFCVFCVFLKISRINHFENGNKHKKVSRIVIFTKNVEFSFYYNNIDLKLSAYLIYNFFFYYKKYILFILMIIPPISHFFFVQTSDKCSQTEAIASSGSLSLYTFNAEYFRLLLGSSMLVLSRLWICYTCWWVVCRLFIKIFFCIYL